MVFGPTFKLNPAGVRQLLRGEDMGKAILEVAEDVADTVRSQTDAEVVVERYMHDRQAASVTIADRRGLRIQASTGALTRAAAAHGLDVTPR